MRVDFELSPMVVGQSCDKGHRGDMPKKKGVDSYCRGELDPTEIYSEMGGVKRILLRRLAPSF